MPIFGPSGDYLVPGDRDPHTPYIEKYGEMSRVSLI